MRLLLFGPTESPAVRQALLSVPVPGCAPLSWHERRDGLPGSCPAFCPPNHLPSAALLNLRQASWPSSPRWWMPQDSHVVPILTAEDGRHCACGLHPHRLQLRVPILQLRQRPRPPAGHAQLEVGLVQHHQLPVAPFIWPEMRHQSQQPRLSPACLSRQAVRQPPSPHPCQRLAPRYRHRH